MDPGFVAYLKDTNPVLFKQLHNTLNNNDGIDIQTLHSRTRKKVWWTCYRSEHSWKEKIQTYADIGFYCPSCIESVSIPSIDKSKIQKGGGKMVKSIKNTLGCVSSVCNIFSSDIGQLVWNSFMSSFM